MGDIANYLSLLKAAQELGVSKSRMEQFVRDGRIAVEWFEGRRVVTKEAVAALKLIPRSPGKPPGKKPKSEKPTGKKGKK